MGKFLIINTKSVGLHSPDHGSLWVSVANPWLSMAQSMGHFTPPWPSLWVHAAPSATLDGLVCGSLWVSTA